MAYDFVFLPDAEKQLRALDRLVAKRILKKLHQFSKLKNPLRTAVRLQNSKIGDARFRVGDYRVVVLVDEKKQIISVAAVGHRREIYR